jgi:hypothetical protein
MGPDHTGPIAVCGAAVMTKIDAWPEYETFRLPAGARE